VDSQEEKQRQKEERRKKRREEREMRRKQREEKMLEEERKKVFIHFLMNLLIIHSSVLQISSAYLSLCKHSFLSYPFSCFKPKNRASF